MSWIRSLAYVAMLVVVAASCAYMPLGQALWFEDLSVGGSVTTGDFPDEWDRSSLQVDDEGVACEPEIRLWATVTNVGDEDMAGPTTATLWHSEKGGPKKGAQVAGVEIVIEPLPAGETVEISIAPPVDAGGEPLYGRFWFVVAQRPEHPSPNDVWSDEVRYDASTCASGAGADAEALPAEGTPLPEAISPTPGETADAIDHTPAAPGVTPTSAGDVTPTPTLAPSEPPPDAAPTEPPAAEPTQAPPTEPPPAP